MTEPELDPLRVAMSEAVPPIHTIDDLADRSNVSRPTLYRFLNGDPRISVSVLSKLAATLGKSLADMAAMASRYRAKAKAVKS